MKKLAVLFLFLLTSCSTLCYNKRIHHQDQDLSKLTLASYWTVEILYHGIPNEKGKREEILDVYGYNEDNNLSEFKLRESFSKISCKTYPLEIEQTIHSLSHSSRLECKDFDSSYILKIETEVYIVDAKNSGLDKVLDRCTWFVFYKNNQSAIVSLCGRAAILEKTEELTND
jgi:hypothetical protein